MAHQIEFKGTKNGIILRYDAALDYNQFTAALRAKLTAANHFFSGSHIIGLEGPPFTAEQEVEISRLFQQLGGMKVLSLEATSHLKRTTTDTAHTQRQQVAPLARAKASDNDAIASVLADDCQGDQTIVHRGTLRSGNRLKSEGHLVLLGDANPGSELLARGHIIVMGALRGFAWAGKDGDADSFIVALKLEPTQLRIASYITRPPDDTGASPNFAEIALVNQGHIIIEPYHK